MNIILQKFVENHKQLVRQIFDNNGSVLPMIVLVGKPIEGGKYLVKPLDIPPVFYQTDMGKDFLVGHILKEEKQELIDMGYKLSLISFTSECWMTKIKIHEDGSKDEVKKEVIFFSFETEDEIKCLSWEIHRSMSVSKDGIYEKVYLEENDDFNEEGQLVGRFSGLFNK